VKAQNVEIKAKCYNIGSIRKILQAENARFIGLDHQVDTYFKVPNGRLKLRRGDIENALIHYLRSNTQEPKVSQVKLFRTTRSEELKAILVDALEVLVVVDKKREIYFINNVKFHLDQVRGLGSFVEIEAIDEDGSSSPEMLREQCETYLEQFMIKQADLVSMSYSDLIMAESI